MARPTRLLAQVCALILAVHSLAAAPVQLSVQAQGPLPGIRPEDSGPFLADQMRASGVADWSFAPAAMPSAADRIEWHFKLDPYAGGNVRQFFPMPGVQRLFGNQHMLTAEAVLFLDGQYQTTMYGQALVQGGAQDKALADFVTRVTQGLLGETGAYRAIDMGPVRPVPKP